MAANENQVCFISVLFPAPVDKFAIEVKAKIEEMLVDVSESHVDLRLGPPTRGATLPRA